MIQIPYDSFEFTDIISIIQKLEDGYDVVLKLLVIF
jgi:hypothetical protein